MYTAKVIQANDITKHPNADRLQILRYSGLQFVVGLDVKVGDTVVLFGADGQLSHDFCKENNLYRDSSLNKDTSKSGFFEDNRRVRAQPFRKEKSYGFVAGLNSFSYLKNFSPEIGMEISEWNGLEICRKYYTPATLKAMRNIQTNGKKLKMVTYSLAEHFDTKRFTYMIPEITKNNLVIITEKVHGTSARSGNVLVTRRSRNIIQWAMSFLLKKFVGTEKTSYELVSGTRRTVCNDRDDIVLEGGADHYRWEWHNKIAPQLHKGETVYYEIVGWDSLGGTIMERQDIQVMKHRKECPLYWPNSMVYSYGCQEGENDVFVYRITQTSEDGTVVELSWNQVVSRSRELGLKPVPVLNFFVAENTEELVEVVNSHMTNSNSTIDNRHLLEGVVVRIESPQGVTVLKEKNYLFGILEGYLKELDSYVDAEEIN